MARAFPGAQGAAAEATGGRGGKIIYVTNLNSDGPGSLREALTTPGPRVVIPRVSGYVDLLPVGKPGKIDMYPDGFGDLTFLGQLAPRGGITVRNAEITMAGASNTIILFFTGRPGIAGGTGPSVGSASLNIYAMFDNHTFLWDHCSASWAGNKALDAWSAGQPLRNVTMSWTHAAEGFAGHNVLVLCGGDHADEMENFDFHHSSLDSSHHRMPLMKVRSGYIVNNVIHNWIGWGASVTGGMVADIVGNCMTDGPETRASNTERRAISVHTHQFLVDLGQADSQDAAASGVGSWYVARNITPLVDDVDTDNWPTIVLRDDSFGGPSNWPFLSGNEPERRDTPRVSPYTYPIAVHDPRKIRRIVVQDSGNSRFINEDGRWERYVDDIDRRTKSHILDNTGAEIGSEADVGGYPDIPSTTPYAMTNGMSDRWLAHHGISGSAPWGNDLDATWTNLECFAFGLYPVPLV